MRGLAGIAGLASETFEEGAAVNVRRLIHAEQMEDGWKDVAIAGRGREGFAGLDACSVHGQPILQLERT